MWRDERLRGLSSDHHQALVLASRLVKASLPSDVSAALDELLDRFDTSLDPHFRVEEALLLPALRALGESELVHRTEEDHAWLRQEVARARGGASIDARAYGERLRAHVRFEEKELFERCQAVVPDEILNRVWDLWPTDESKRRS